MPTTVPLFFIASLEIWNIKIFGYSIMWYSLYIGIFLSVIVHFTTTRTKLPAYDAVFTLLGIISSVL